MKHLNNEIINSAANTTENTHFSEDSAFHALTEDKQSQLIEKIKISVTEIVYDSQKPLSTNFSNYLSNKLRYNYTYMANLFSKAQGMTIEHYLIVSKIERVKELLIIGKHNLTEISYMLHYSSVAHLSNQFKKVTGFTPSFFKQKSEKR